MNSSPVFHLDASGKPNDLVVVPPSMYLGAIYLRVCVKNGMIDREFRDQVLHDITTQTSYSADRYSAVPFLRVDLACVFLRQSGFHSFDPRARELGLCVCDAPPYPLSSVFCGWGFDTTTSSFPLCDSVEDTDLVIDMPMLHNAFNRYGVSIASKLSASFSLLLPDRLAALVADGQVTLSVGAHCCVESLMDVYTSGTRMPYPIVYKAVLSSATQNVTKAVLSRSHHLGFSMICVRVARNDEHDDVELDILPTVSSCVMNNAVELKRCRESMNTAYACFVCDAQVIRESYSAEYSFTFDTTGYADTYYDVHMTFITSPEFSGAKDDDVLDVLDW